MLLQIWRLVMVAATTCGGAYMKTWGQLLMVVGVLTVLSALFIMQTTIEGGYGSFSSGSVVNLGLLQRQTLFTHVGLALFNSGVVFTAAGSIQDYPSHISTRLETPLSEEALRPEYQAPPPAEDDNRLWVICGVVIAIVAAAVLYNSWSSTLDNRTAIEMNADTLADNMEMQADAMDAMADNLTATQ